MYDRYAARTVTVDSSVERVFEWLDDQTRLSGHMEKRSWKMGWGKMHIALDDGRGRVVGSHIVLSGRVLGVALSLDEVVIRREPPRAKTWETVGEPRLLVIGPYRMGFELAEAGDAARLCVDIHYRLPARGLGRLLGRLWGDWYANWCVTKMAEDARASFSARESVPGLQT